MKRLRTGHACCGALLVRPDALVPPLISGWSTLDATSPMPYTTFIRPGRRFAIASAALLALAILLFAGAAWYYSSVIRSGLLKPDYSPSTLNLRVVDVVGDHIVLTPRSDDHVSGLDDNELWGLQGASGYGQVGQTLNAEGKQVTRQFTLLNGSINPGDFARLDSFAYRGDPMSARGIAFHDVTIPSQLGDLPAWKVDGSSDTWVIFVHGWRADREEALRMLPTISSLGLPSLVISYRNDAGAPPNSDGLIWWGATEWQDLEAAVDYAAAQGARSIVLYGYSMGGGISISFLEHSTRSGLVSGVILDAPVLDFDALVDFQAGRRHLPGFLTAAGKKFASWRFGVDWSSMDYVTGFDRVHVPVLLFHGTNDDRAPIDVSRRLARDHSDIVTYIEVPGAGHVRSWNVDPAAYQQNVETFLERVAVVPVRLARTWPN